MGRWVFEECILDDKTKILSNSPEEELINDLMQYMIEKDGVKNRKEWRAYVVETEELNAFAAAGGRV